MRPQVREGGAIARLRARPHDRRVLRHRAPDEQPVYKAVRAHLDTLDDVYVEPVSVGIFFKRSRTFAQLRPKQRWVALGFILPHKVDHPRLSRKVTGEGSRFSHVVNLRTPDDVDDTIRDWLTEAYLHAD